MLNPSLNALQALLSSSEYAFIAPNINPPTIAIFILKVTALIGSASILAKKRCCIWAQNLPGMLPIPFIASTAFALMTSRLVGCAAAPAVPAFSMVPFAARAKAAKRLTLPAVLVSKALLKAMPNATTRPLFAVRNSLAIPPTCLSRPPTLATDIMPPAIESSIKAELTIIAPLFAVAIAIPLSP